MHYSLVTIVLHVIGALCGNLLFTEEVEKGEGKGTGSTCCKMILAFAHQPCNAACQLGASGVRDRIYSTQAWSLFARMRLIPFLLCSEFLPGEEGGRREEKLKEEEETVNFWKIAFVFSNLYRCVGNFKKPSFVVSCVDA